MTKTFPFFLSLAISLLACNGIIANGAHAFVLTRGTEKYHNPRRNHHIVKTSSHRILSPLHQLSASPSDDNDKQDSNTSATNPILKAPTFNGQLILPVKVVLNGLKGHKVAAVYALQPTKQSGYSAVKYISITRDLLTDLQSLRQKYPGQMEYIRALSFSYPQKAAMQDVAQRWEAMVLQEGGKLGLDEEESPNNQEQDGGVFSDEDYYDEEEEEDDDDDDEFEWDDPETSTTAAADLFVDETKKTSSPQVISPFQEEEVSTTSSSSTTSSDDEKLEFSREAVDKVLDEIRPYLISDGGNVSIHSIDEKTKSVYLTLEGACGSCPSSTVTMQMGIERILREKFDNIGTVEQVQPSSEDVSDGSSKKGITMEAVMKEINRIGPAISAMGGMVEVLSVDELGVVEVRFRGANKVQQGLELALRDVPNVKHVKFVN